MPDQGGSKEAQFKELFRADEEAFQGLEEPTFSKVVTVSEQGAESMGKPAGSEWLGFTYYDKGEIYHGAIDPTDGQVIATGSEMTWWFD
ncbi:hypothetical protein COV06_03710 [Candidatus Uhrbacteria bacterium CG10_big_fil_rev_8_21_14_0_10_50_16]|uniref:Uncharacterized protein n=1 Tax=Candidatus Uhrbacteria bacterium CG10_big_fil_rev_8_21_14_0_10_50_16 TaxID=1975039 RepID=A0A2H0RLD0_9BACT|nr:MAG: hypothetical protein COV06_03710 [Candidatus Uhrbacteria bacterium CG10_big_fil_rev_8_21_14_0_10_50_16]